MTVGEKQLNIDNLQQKSPMTWLPLYVKQVPFVASTKDDNGGVLVGGSYQVLPKNASRGRGRLTKEQALHMR